MRGRQRALRRTCAEGGLFVARPRRIPSCARLIRLSSCLIVANSTIVRVVLDTNVLLSACWSPGGLEARLVQLSISAQLSACVSPAVVAEYRDVLSRPKFIGIRVIADETLNAFERAATMVQP